MTRFVRFSSALRALRSLRLPPSAALRARPPFPVPLQPLEPRTLLSAAVAGQVWLDAKLNHLRDPGEPPAPAITVSLLDAAGLTLAQTTTAPDGAYRFDDLPLNQPLSLLFTQPDGYRFVSPNNGADDTLDSDVNHLGQTPPFTLSPDQTLTFDAGLTGNTLVTGIIYHDANGNGQNDAEPPLANRTIFADANNNAQLDPLERSTLSASNGAFTFAGLLPGTYTLREIAPGGSTPAPLQTITLAPGQRLSNIILASQSLSLPTVFGPVGAPINVSVEARPNGSPPAVAMLPDGDFLVAWFSNYPVYDYPSLFVRRYNAAGTPQGNLLFVDTGGHAYPSAPFGLAAASAESCFISLAAVPDGGFVIAWQEELGQQNVHAARYDASGTRIGSIIYPGTGLAPRVALAPNGGFLVTWYRNTLPPYTGANPFVLPGQTDFDIFARRYNAQGLPQTDEFRVNTDTTGNQYDPIPAFDAAGNAVILWTTQRDDAPGSLNAQRLDPAGQPLGQEFRVADLAPGRSPRGADLAMNADGRFAVVWADQGIHLQRFLPNALPDGAPTLVTRPYSTDAHGPQAALSDTGDLLVSWFSNDSSPGSGIAARRYPASATQPDREFLVSSDYYAPYDLAANSAGDAVIAWTTDNVYVQRCQPARSPDPTLTGSSDSETYVLTRVGDHYYVYRNTPTGLPIAHFPSPSSITFNTLTGDDTLILDFSGGNPIPPAGLTFNAGQGNDTLQFINTRDYDALTLADNLITYADTRINSPVAWTLATASLERVTLTPSSTGNILAYLALAGSVRATIAPDGNPSLLLPTLSLQDTATLDLTTHTLLTQTPLAILTPWLRSNRLFTSQKTPHTTLAPHPQPDGSTLLTPTLFGDTNHDGQVNLTDYFTIDAGYLNKAQGFANGDVNLDGEINLTDYFLIDSAYLNQQPPLSSSPHLLIASSSPSPSSFRRSVASSLPSKKLLKAPKKNPHPFSHKKRIH